MRAPDHVEAAPGLMRVLSRRAQVLAKETVLAALLAHRTVGQVDDVVQWAVH